MKIIDSIVGWRSNQITRLLSYWPFGCFIFGSWLLYRYGIKPQSLNNRLIFDAEIYSRLSFAVETDREIYSPLRTYGYPLFLYLARILSFNKIPWVEWVWKVQWLLHVATAFLAVGLGENLAKTFNLEISRFSRLVIFGLVQLNFCLLPLAFEILTESLTIFLITLFLWAMTAQFSSSRIVMGLAAGAAAVTRPFYGVFLPFFGLCWTGASLMNRKLDLKTNRLSNFIGLSIYLLILLPQSIDLPQKNGVREHGSCGMSWPV